MTRKADVRKIPITVYMLPLAVQHLDRIARDGFYGNGSRSQAAERLLCRAMIEYPLPAIRIHPNSTKPSA